MKFYITEETKKEIDEILEGLKSAILLNEKLDCSNENNFVEYRKYKEILSNSVVIHSVNKTRVGHMKIFVDYPNGVIIEK